MSAVAQKQSSKLTRTLIQEQSFGDAPQVDREAGVIRDVKVLGAVSKNGREYSRKALTEACSLLEGIQVNLDHNRDNPKRERGFMESVGTLNDLYLKPDGVYAKEFRVKKTHPYAPTLFESAERFPKNFGLSINGEGEVARRNGKNVVESLVNAQSVDVVGKPATTDGIFESETEKVEPVKKSIKQLVEQIDNAEIKSRFAKLIEDGSVDQMMSSDMPVEEGLDGAEPDPMDQMSDAFNALVLSVIADDSLDVKAKIAKITSILNTQDELMNGPAASDSTETTDTTESEDETDDDELKESIKQLAKVNQDLISRQANTDAKLLLLESNRKPLPDRIKSLVEAKDDAARTALIESWPQEKTVTKPTRSAPLFESSASSAKAKYPADNKSFCSALKN